MRRHYQQSILTVGVPLSRGRPTHFEHDDDTAFTLHGTDDQVREIHTPEGRDSLRRIHELMHARHSHAAEQKKCYTGIAYDTVKQVTEDCRIHLLHWPWRAGRTPAPIAADARAFVSWEVRRAVKQARAAIAAGKADKAAWPCFAVRIRAASVLAGSEGNLAYELRRLFTGSERKLAATVTSLLQGGETQKAAQILQAAFFDPPAQEEEEEQRGEEDSEPSDEDGEERRASVMSSRMKMQIIELPHTETIREAEMGTRIATSGSRIFRPALRRPVLPSRMFVRRAVMEPQGTILIDASGSMGKFSFVEDQCKAAPFATVAYYAGNGRDGGWLYVYARGGMRARELIEPDGRDNTVDGPAMDWLLKQEAPRILVTDREFCDARDSAAQVIRLERFERAGLITVREYKS